MSRVDPFKTLEKYLTRPGPEPWSEGDDWVYDEAKLAEYANWRDGVGLNIDPLDVEPPRALAADAQMLSQADRDAGRQFASDPVPEILTEQEREDMEIAYQIRMMDEGSGENGGGGDDDDDDDDDYEMDLDRDSDNDDTDDIMNAEYDDGVDGVVYDREGVPVTPLTNVRRVVNPDLPSSLEMKAQRALNRAISRLLVRQKEQNLDAIRSAQRRVRAKTVSLRKARMDRLFDQELREDTMTMRRPWIAAGNPLGVDSISTPEDYIRYRLPQSLAYEFDDNTLLEMRNVGTDSIVTTEDDPLNVVLCIIESRRRIGKSRVSLNDGIPFGDWKLLTEPLGKYKYVYRNGKKKFYSENLPTSIDKLYPGSFERLWSRIQRLWYYMEWLFVTIRIIDSRNPNQTSIPLSNGENITDPALTAAWVLHRAWIRALHHRTLEQGKINTGMDFLTYIRMFSRCLLMIELEDAPRPSNIKHCYGPLWSTFELLLRNFEILGNFIKTETRRAQYQYTARDTRIYNLNPKIIEPVINNFWNALTEDALLGLRLHNRARQFNLAMCVSHVEDVLIDKRVVLQDEEYRIRTHLSASNYHPWLHDFRGHRVALKPGYFDNKKDQNAENKLQKVLMDITQINALRRNKLMLNDWCGSRPWKQLYEMIDTGPVNQTMWVNRINGFWTLMRTMRAQYPSHANGEFNPSAQGNIWGHINMIHPLSSTATPAPDQVGPYWENGCPLCQYDYKDECDKLIIRLHCNHLFHFACIQGMWTAPDRVMYSCPICRTSFPDWKMHNHTGITPENKNLDVWDHAQVMDEGLDGSPNLTETYDRQDRSILQTSFYDRQKSYEKGPWQEMAVMRAVRRDRNKAKAQLLENINMGFQSVDLDQNFF